MTGIAIESMISKYENKVRAIPNGVEYARSRVGQLGTVDFILHSSSQFFPLNEGILGYDVLDWGPQPVRMIFAGEHVGMAYVVSGDSDIYTMEDLRGKKISCFPGGPGTTARLTAKLWFAGLTWDDVDIVEFTSPSKAYSAVIDGKIDSTYMNMTAGKAYEFESMPGGMRWLPLPFDNEEGWERFWSKAPNVTQKLANVGAGGLSDENPLECVGLMYPTYLAWPFADEDIIYFVAKAFHECYPLYAEKNEAMKRTWTHEGWWAMWDAPPAMLPLHEGAIRYYKDIGEWTPEREAIQQERLQHQAELQALWETTKSEALDQGMKGADFPAFWLEKRAAAGLYVPDPMPC